MGGTAGAVLALTVLVATGVAVSGRWGHETYPAARAAAPAAAPSPSLSALSVQDWDIGATPAPAGSDDPPSGRSPAAAGGSVAPSTAAPPPPAPAGAFVAVAGDSCPQTAISGSYVAYPLGNPVTELMGGWRDNGCTGRFWSVPMSGSATDDPQTYAVWWFATGSVQRGTCAISVYVPDSDSTKDVAGNPTVYQVTRGRDDKTVVGVFSVDQTATRGSWVRVGSFPDTTGTIAVKLVNHGDGTDGGRHAAAQVQAICTPR